MTNYGTHIYNKNWNEWENGDNNFPIFITKPKYFGMSEVVWYKDGMSPIPEILGRNKQREWELYPDNRKFSIVILFLLSHVLNKRNLSYPISAPR